MAIWHDVADQAAWLDWLNAAPAPCALQQSWAYGEAVRAQAHDARRLALQGRRRGPGHRPADPTAALRRARDRSFAARPGLARRNCRPVPRAGGDRRPRAAPPTLRHRLAAGRRRRQAAPRRLPPRLDRPEHRLARSRPLIDDAAPGPRRQMAQHAEPGGGGAAGDPRGDVRAPDRLAGHRERAAPPAGRLPRSDAELHRQARQRGRRAAIGDRRPARRRPGRRRPPLPPRPGRHLLCGRDVGPGPSAPRPSPAALGGDPAAAGCGLHQPRSRRHRYGQQPRASPGSSSGWAARRSPSPAAICCPGAGDDIFHESARSPKRKGRARARPLHR